MDAGVSSLHAAELAGRLSDRSGAVLSPTLMFEHPTARSIARAIAEQLRGATAGAAPSAVVAAQSLTPAASTTVLSSCVGRWPGGCTYGLAQLPMLWSAGNAIRSVPAARWTLAESLDVERLSSVQAACAGHGGFVARAHLFANEVSACISRWHAALAADEPQC